MEQKYDVFISYSRKDYVDENMNVIPDNVISQIKGTLSKEGISYWFDEEGIYSGDNFVDKIVNNIEASRIFLFLSTANANNSPWTCKEIACADEFGKYIIPVRIDKTPYNKKVLFRIADLSYISFYANPKRGMQDIVSTIKTFLQQLEDEKKQKREAQLRREAEKRRQEQISLLTKQINEVAHDVENYTSLLEDARLRYNDLVSKLNALTSEAKPSIPKNVVQEDTVKAPTDIQENPVTSLDSESVNFLQAIKSCFRNYFNFRGKASRSEYWWWQVFRALFYIIIFGGYIYDYDYYFDSYNIFSFLFIVVLILSNLSVFVRRLHDSGHSGWWILCPIYNIVLLFYKSVLENKVSSIPTKQ